MGEIQPVILYLHPRGMSKHSSSCCYKQAYTVVVPVHSYSIASAVTVVVPVHSYSIASAVKYTCIQTLY